MPLIARSTKNMLLSMYIKENRCTVVDVGQCIHEFGNVRGNVEILDFLALKHLAIP